MSNLLLKGVVNSERAGKQAEMLAGRVKKAFKKWHGRYDRQGIGAFRLYDWDIPEVRAVVDWYEGHLVVGEYERRQTRAAGDWLYIMGTSVASALGVPEAFVHLKRRHTGGKGQRYAAQAGTAGKGPGAMVVRERDLRFRVNLNDYLDTGLFSDHRNTRAWVRKMAADRSVLNLFAYTGTFTASALAGGAKHVTSVDTSKTYIDWAQANLRENQLPLERHEPARADVMAFLSHAAAHGRRWDVVVVDPPSYSTVGGGSQGFDVQRDHPELLQAVLRVTAKGGMVSFSTNHQRFEPKLHGLDADIEETTHVTVPPDYRNRQTHRSWRLVPARLAS